MSSGKNEMVLIIPSSVYLFIYFLVGFRMSDQKAAFSEWILGQAYIKKKISRDVRIEWDVCESAMLL